MTKYKAKTALSISLDPKKPWRTKLVRVGDEVELTDEQAQSLRDAGVLVEDGDEDAPREDVTTESLAAGPAAEGDDEETAEPVELPARPSNGASKDIWRKYLEALSAATEEEAGPLDVPEDATRDQMIVIGDQRVAEFESEED